MLLLRIKYNLQYAGLELVIVHRKLANFLMRVWTHLLQFIRFYTFLEPSPVKDNEKITSPKKNICVENLNCGLNFSKMKKRYFIILLVLTSSILTAQTIIFADAVFKAKLLQSDTNSLVARNLSDDYFSIDVNNNGEIEIAEALQVSHLNIEGSSISSVAGIANFTNLTSLQCGSNSMSSLNVENLTKLTELNCNSNILTSLTLTGAINLQNLNCQSNKLTALNLNNFTNLVTIDCSDNRLTTVNLTGLTNLQSFICTSNSIAALNLDDLTSLQTLECNRNLLASLDFSKLTEITSLNCSFNRLSSLNVSSLLDLNSLECSNNQLLSLNVDGLSRLITLNCSTNLLAGLTINTLFNITFLNCSINNLQSIVVTGLGKLKVLNVSKNQLSTLDIYGLTSLQFLYCNTNKLVSLDASNQIGLQLLFIYDNLLSSLFIKNGSAEYNLIFSGNPNLNYICADESELAFVQEEITNNSYTNCVVNSYCSFVPGGDYYTIEGQNKYDSTTNGCDATDGNFPNLSLAITDDTNSTTFIADSTGISSYGLTAGTYTVSALLENPTYYTITPSKYTVSFPAAASSFSTPFCISPNGSHTDLEIVLLPVDNAKTNFNSTYKIIFKNKGTVTKSGAISLTFDSISLNFVTANPSFSSQGATNLSWNFTNLLPQETRTILVTMKVQAAVIDGYVLNFKTNITDTADNTPNDNNAELNQKVVNTASLNDKICLEGTVVSPSQAGDYLHYMIRFEHSGSTNAQNIVVKDLIDVSKFDIATLVPLDGSHPFTTKITDGNAVEFIFQNINLPSEAAVNRGYVAFKIKTLSTIPNASQLTNSATIYFDFQPPFDTNIATTTLQTLKTQDNVFRDRITIYPNPVQDTLNIAYKEAFEISRMSIYNTLGQLVAIIINEKPNATAVDVSQLKSGIYFIKIDSDKGSRTAQFIKE